MKEDLLHFIWQYKLLKPGELRTVNGTAVKILRTGELNRNAGPDFFNAQIKLGYVTLAGNVEIHVRSSDWLRHGHQDDPAYDKIILHVVYEHDVPLEQNSRFNVEVLELKEHVDGNILSKYATLTASKTELACARQIGTVDPSILQIWLRRMLTERLQAKTAMVKQIYESGYRDYSQAFYILLARNFGFKTNSEPFELLARKLSLQVLLRHQHNLVQLEALLFGAAGFLNEQLSDKYLRQLQNEFEFLARKYSIQPMDVSLWKFSRMRPANFPTVRLAQFALLLHHSPSLISDPLAYADLKTLKRALSHAHPGYWRNHYRPDGEEAPAMKGMGDESVHNIMINTMAPFLFFYGRQTGNEQTEEAALNCFDELPFEDNIKTRVYIKAGLKPATAGESQALINLYDNYCKQRLCMRCTVASQLLLKG